MDKTKAMAWFIVLVMVFSVMGIVGSSFFSEDEGRSEYNGFSFIKMGAQWLLRSEVEDYYFQYLPPELEDITSPSEIDLSVSRMYMGFQPKDTVDFDKAINLISYVLYNNFKIMPQKACIVERNCPDIPIIDCSEKPGIIVLSGEKNSYTRDEKCLIITAVDNQELDKLTERLIYKLVGVMD